MSKRELRKLQTFRTLGSSSSETSPTEESSHKSDSTGATFSASRSTLQKPQAQPELPAFIQRNGRTFINRPDLPYPLPVDMAELHRQSLRTTLLVQVHGAPLTCSTAHLRTPKRVLELGCGTGLWSMLCHRYLSSLGHSDVSFTGIDIAPLSSNSLINPDGMQWTFVQHDLTQMPWPFLDETFDIILHKDMTLAVPSPLQLIFTNETLRILKSGGTLEVWETDHPIRLLRPHVPNVGVKPEHSQEQEAKSAVGAYSIWPNTALSAPLHTQLAEYSRWISRALETRQLMPNPCTGVYHYLHQEPLLTDVQSHRVAIPFSEMRWERGGIAGVVTREGKSYVKTTQRKTEKGTLMNHQAALRRTALLTMIQGVQAQETLLREVCEKSQKEWDLWLERLMTDLLNEDGASSGECLEVGAWSARKK